MSESSVKNDQAEKKSTKALVLAELMRCSGEYVSGAKLAKALGRSRNAVWKAVEALKQEGCLIEAVTNKGYRLQPMRVLSKEAILFRLEEDPPLSSISDANVVVLPQTSSTNTEMKKRLLEEALPEGTIIVADQQTAGRGHKGAGFFSPKGCGLYVSVLLRESLAGIEDRKLSEKSAVAMVRTVRDMYHAEIRIRPVNNLMAKEGKCYKKVGGILTEVSRDIETGDTEYAIVGVGLRVTRPKEGYPTDIAEETTDVASILPKQDNQAQDLFDCSYLAARFVKELWKALSDPSTEEEYKSLLIEQ